MRLDEFEVMDKVLTAPPVQFKSYIVGENTWPSHAREDAYGGLTNKQSLQRVVYSPEMCYEYYVICINILTSAVFAAVLRLYSYEICVCADCLLCARCVCVCVCYRPIHVLCWAPVYTSRCGCTHTSRRVNTGGMCVACSLLLVPSSCGSKNNNFKKTSSTDILLDF